MVIRGEFSQLYQRGIEWDGLIEVPQDSLDKLFILMSERLKCIPDVARYKENPANQGPDTRNHYSTNTSRSDNTLR